MKLAISRDFIIDSIKCTWSADEMVPLSLDGRDTEVSAKEALIYFRSQTWKWQVGDRTFADDAELEAFRSQEK